VDLTFKKDETLIEQGERGVGLYIIASGEVKIVKKTAGGDELEVALHRTGDFFGEMAVLDDAPRSASVIAVADTKCLFLSAWDFKARMKLHPEIAMEILPVVVKRFRETNAKLLALSRP
jgi:CRP-like cAMP-binding protein